MKKKTREKDGMIEKKDGNEKVTHKKVTKQIKEECLKKLT